jgi:hypothetical protein
MQSLAAKPLMAQLFMKFLAASFITIPMTAHGWPLFSLTTQYLLTFRKLLHDTDKYVYNLWYSGHQHNKKCYCLCQFYLIGPHVGQSSGSFIKYVSIY